MASKAIVFLAIFLAAFVLIFSEVTARDLAETAHTESTKETDQYGYGGPGYGGRGPGYGYGGRGPGYGGGRYGGGGGRYGGGGGRYGGGGGRCGGYGCCGRGYYRCQCCTFAGQKPDAGYTPENENDVKSEVKP